MLRFKQIRTIFRTKKALISNSELNRNDFNNFLFSLLGDFEVYKAKTTLDVIKRAQLTRLRTNPI